MSAQASDLAGRVHASPWFANPALGEAVFAWYDATGRLHEVAVGPKYTREQLFWDTPEVLAIARDACSAEKSVRLSWVTMAYDELADRNVAVVQSRPEVQVIAVYPEAGAIVVTDAMANQVIQLHADTVTEIWPS